MSKPKGKVDKSHPALSSASASASISVAEISSLLEEHRLALAADFKKSFDSLTSTLDTLHTKVTDHGQRISSLEDNATDTDHLHLPCNVTTRILGPKWLTLRVVADDRT